MPMGIDNDYDGVGNADDPTPNGSQDQKVMALMQALAALLEPTPTEGEAPMGQHQPSNNMDALKALLAQLTGAQTPQAPSAPMAINAPMPSPSGPVTGEGPGAAAGTPEDDVSAAPTPFKPKSPDAMEALPETTDSSPTNKPKAEPDEDDDNGTAKSAMSKLAKKRGGK